MCRSSRRSPCSQGRASRRTGSTRTTHARSTSTTRWRSAGCVAATCWRWPHSTRHRACCSFRSTRHQPTVRRSDATTGVWRATWSWDTLGVPGLTTLSTLPLPDDPNAYAIGWTTDHRIPLEDRWGSWYVTGAPPALRHLGNTTAPMASVPGPDADPAPVLDTLEGLFDPLRLSHPLQRHRGAARAGASDAHDQPAGPHGVGDPRGQLRSRARRTTVRRPDRGGDPGHGERARRLSPARPRGAASPRHPQHLWIRSAVLGPGPVRQPGPVAAPARPRRPGYSRYPCSFLIYTDAFDALPERAKDAVYRRMWELLSKEATEDRAPRLTLDKRRAVVEILRDTKPNLPAYFQGAVR